MAELSARVSAAIRSLDEVVSSPCAPKGASLSLRREAPGSAAPESGRKRSRLEALVDLYTSSSAATANGYPAQTPGQSSSSTGDAGGAPAGSACRPWDRQDFWERAETFRIHTWFGKPAAVSPLECARFGWTNSARDTLQCRLCQATLYFPVATNTALVGTAALDEAARDFRRQLRSGHSDVCPWRCKGATSPAHFASILPVAPSSASANLFLATKQLAAAVAAASAEVAARVQAATSALCSELESTLWSSATSLQGASSTDGGALVAGVAAVAARVLEASGSGSSGSTAGAAAATEPTLRACALSSLICAASEGSPAAAARRSAVVLALTGWRPESAKPGSTAAGDVHLHCAACNRSVTAGGAASGAAVAASPAASPEPATPHAQRTPASASLMSAAKAAMEAAARASAVFRGASPAAAVSVEPVAKRLRLGGEAGAWPATPGGPAGVSAGASSALTAAAPSPSASTFHPLRSHAWYCPMTRPVALSSGAATAVQKQLAAVAAAHAGDAAAPPASTASTVDASRGSVVEALTMVTEAAFGGADPSFVLGLVNGAEVAATASTTARGAFDGDDDTVDEADGAALAAAAGAGGSSRSPPPARLPGWALLALLAAAAR